MAPNGYNLTSGGQAGMMFDPEVAKRSADSRRGRKASPEHSISFGLPISAADMAAQSMPESLGSDIGEKAGRIVRNIGLSLLSFWLFATDLPKQRAAVAAARQSRLVLSGREKVTVSVDKRTGSVIVDVMTISREEIKKALDDNLGVAHAQIEESKKAGVHVTIFFDAVMKLIEAEEEANHLDRLDSY